VIELDPHEVGQDTANWTTERLARYLGQHTGIQVTEETVRVYLHAHGYVCKRPTLTRLWGRKGRRGQRLVQAPGDNRKVYGFGLVDWRDGWFDGRVAPGRTADGFCEQVRAATARSKQRGWVAIVIADNLRTHTAAGSLLVRSLLSEFKDHLYLVYTPAYDPDANRIEWHGPCLATSRDTQSSP
jgi:DDE superfamily endonuclease/Winged helix-turn helix